MTREIKFRAWDKKYMYYDLDYLQSRGSIVLGGMGDCFDLSSEIDLEHVKLMQSTGLKDKNGKEIYEGDIVKHEYNKGQSDVFFDLGRFQPFSYLGSYMGSEYEVIGNIYENPELLKGVE